MLRKSTRKLLITVAIAFFISLVSSLLVLQYTLKSPPSPLPGPTSVSLVDKVLRELSWGNIAFNAPSTMRYKQPRTVELLLSPSLSASQLQAQLEQRVASESDRVRISNRMEAELAGRGFTVEALTPSLQAIASMQTSRWKWEVTPTDSGPQRLYITLSAHIDVAGRDAPLVVRTFDRTIDVEITIPLRVSEFIEKNWQWLWAALLVPIAGYLWRHWMKRSDAPKPA